MQENKPRRLRWELARALIFTFCLLWIGFVVLVHNNRVQELDVQMASSYGELLSSMENYVLPDYEANLESGLGEQADHMLAYQLSIRSGNAITDEDGGLALAVHSHGTSVRSQITWGRGYTADNGEWFLYFDESLTDQGQLDFARWMVDNRTDWFYSVQPSYSHRKALHGESNVARVSGLKLRGGGIQVQTIDLVHPDGEKERIFTADIPAETNATIDLSQMYISSVLFPSWSSDGKDGPVRMEERLENFRIAQSFIDRELGGEERPVLTRSGRLSGGSSAKGYSYWIAMNCNTRWVASCEQWGLYLSSFLFAIAVLMTLSTHLSRKVTRPMETLSRDVETGRCQTDGTITELNTLAAAFNGAQDKLAQQLVRERNFTRAAAHELKTPLAVLRAHAEALQEDIDPQKRDAYLAVVLDEADRMAALTGNLLELSRLEGGAPLKQEPVELAALVREVFDRLALPMEQKGLSVTMETAETWVSGDSERLREVVDNLATNVLRYCPDGKAVRVTLIQKGDMACLRVYNEGEPIPEDDLPHLWEPFYRVDRSRSRQSGGTGLGLAIVRATVAAHGGTCTVENVPGGVAFGVRLPLMVENK